MTDWQRQGIVFGEIPRSGNYFLLPPSGEHGGQVFYDDHDGFHEEPIAGSFEGFLDSIIADPADFLYRLGCFARYSDGKTDIQWIPKEFVSGRYACAPRRSRLLQSNSRLTDSLRWIRLMASPNSGATLSTVILGIICSGGSGIVSVMTTSSNRRGL